MSRVCALCGKGKMSGNKVSHSNRKTPRAWNVNVQKVRIDTLGKQYVCTRCLRTKNKAD